MFQIFNNNDNTNIITISQVAKLTAETGDSMEFFGWTVAIHGNAILVSALGVDNISGSVYFFGNPWILNGNGWQLGRRWNRQ